MSYANRLYPGWVKATYKRPLFGLNVKDLGDEKQESNHVSQFIEPI
jgi:hypothetical protein